MKGGLTIYEFDTLRIKSRAFDEIAEYINGRCDSEKLIAISDIVARAEREAELAMAKRPA